MGDMLSQAEIDALLGGTDENTKENTSTTNQINIEPLTEEEKDALGEIGNISMGTAATTLFTLLNQRVTITTPKVKTMTWEELGVEYQEPCVAINVEYKEGLEGINLLILKEEDVKVIADLMMGGDGTNVKGELTELHLSAISEAMNQMVGSASTSMSSMFNKKIDISPPKAFATNLNEGDMIENVGFGENGIVRIAFKMEIGDLIDSEIMQILPIDFAKTLVKNLIEAEGNNSDKNINEHITKDLESDIPMQTSDTSNLSNQSQQQVKQNINPQVSREQEPQIRSSKQETINVKPAQFQNFDTGAVVQQKENIDLIMDVPLEVTVELGRTHKLIREILEFSPGTIIELDKLAGEPIDILVNGKFVAKGEVVVIDENFGIRITDIINVENRI
ncbi:flagellar motor switch phosphatase FliY [Defluviitalea phaphyphila]|uniref:flagellar motor switch phosphatase FliY n=1 Tax=Defluviitalea phaphyphila TaxID=1473580 RepID=UPI00073106B7|nr:flagellar motor switch phosphatase FliY [Defluviitalea phaphyphila]